MKKTKMLSRRRRTARRILIAAAALFLVNRIFLIGLVFPIQAIRHTEERMGTGRTAVVCRESAPEIYRSLLLYLTENENVTMLSGARLTLYGWMDSFGVALDCTEEAPIHGGWWSMSREQGQSLLYVFGRVDDPDIDLLQITARHNDPQQPKHFDWSLEREDFIEKDGQFYFLVKKYPVDWRDYPSGVTITVQGIDLEGNILAKVELDQGASSSFA